MKLRHASILTILLALAPHPAGADDGTFYLHTSSVLIPLAGGRTGSHVLTHDAPPIGDPRWLGANIDAGDNVLMGEFVAPPAPGPAQVNPSPVTATLHLVTTGPTIGKAMFKCAEVHIDIYHESPGHRILIADALFQNITIPADHRIGHPVPPLPLTFPLTITASRTGLAPGDGISTEIRVRNNCTDLRRVLLLYDSDSKPSRLQLGDNCPGLPNPDQLDSDGDGIGDACQGGPPQGSPDTDGDGVGEAFDACPGTPPGQIVDRTGCACSQLVCDDGDPCTADSCVPGQGCQHLTDCACPTLSCDDHDPCTADSCQPGAGCQHVAVVDIDAAACQLHKLRDALTTAPPGSVVARISKPGSALMRALTRSLRLVTKLQARRVRFNGVLPPGDPTLRRLQHAFARAVALIDVDGRRNLIGADVHARMAGIIDQITLAFAAIGTP